MNDSDSYIAGGLYVVTAYSAVTVTIKGKVFLSLDAGTQGQFVYPEKGVEITIAGDCSVTRVPFSVAPLASAGAGGDSSIESSGIMPVEQIEWIEKTLKAGVMYKVFALTDLYFSDYTLPAKEGECATCELIVDTTYTNTESLDPSMILWPESWEWVSGTNTAGSAPTLEGGKHYYFAIRTVMGKTLINHYLTTDPA